MENIRVQRIDGPTFLNLLLVGSLVTHVLFTVFAMALVPFAGVEAVTSAGESLAIWQQELVLAGYLFIGVFFAAFWALILWLGLYPGIWVYSKISPLRLGYEPLDEEASSPTP